MKRIVDTLVLTLLVLLTFSFTAHADDLCYGPVRTTGIKLLGIGLAYGVETPIRNTSGKTLSDVTIIKSFNGINMDIISRIELDGDKKTPAKDTDNAQTSDDLLSLNIGNAGLFSGMFNHGIVYGLNKNGGGQLTFSPNETHTIYDKSTFSLNWSKVTINAYYTKNGTQYKVKLNPCETLSVGKEREFELRTKHNIEGDMVVIGNTVLCENPSGGCTKNSTTSNSQLELKYINKANYQGSFKNSSKAKLEGIPEDASVAWAGLYTQGYLQDITKESDVRKHFDGSGDIDENIYIDIGGETYASRPEVVDSLPNITTVRECSGFLGLSCKDVDKTVGYTYEAFASLNDLLGKKGSEINGWVTAKNIKAYTGKDSSGLGNFGAWTLVVVYEYDPETIKNDSSIKRKNITVFDGYKRVSKATNEKMVDIEVDGFMTPVNSDVNSQLSLFIGEGDKDIDDDKLYMKAGSKSSNTSSYTAINKTNAFYSNINGVTRDPSITNNHGIDIQNHNIGNTGSGNLKIIGNSDSKAAIKLTSDGDTYFPSMVAFTTDLYKPYVCYREDIFVDGIPIEQKGSVSQGDKLEFKVAITNTDFESAFGVNVQKTFIPQEFKYEKGSLEVGSGTDEYGNYKEPFNPNAFKQEDDSSFNINIGEWASSSEGGTVKYTVYNNDPDLPKYDYSFAYNAEIAESNASKLSSIYTVSYRNDDIGMTPVEGAVMSLCSGGQNIIDVGASGEFQVVQVGQACGGRKFTEVVNKPFEVDIIRCNNDKEVVNSEEVKLDMDYTDQSGNLIQNAGTHTFPAGVSRYTTTIPALPRAMKKVGLSIIKDNNGNYYGDPNLFAVRPERFNAIFPPNIKAGEDFNITIQALDANGIPALDYNESIGSTFLLTYKDQKNDDNCSTGSFTPSIESGWSFQDGTATLQTSYSEIGILDFNITDGTNNNCNTKYATIDCGDTGITPEQLTIESYNGFVEIHPHHFNISPMVGNISDGFTYIGAPEATSAELTLNVTAKNAQDGITTNYSSECYAKDVVSTLSIPPAITINAMKYGTPSSRVKFYSDNNTTTIGTIQDNNASFVSLKDNFGGGKADLIAKFNFARDATIPDNPFAVTAKMFDLNVTDGFASGSINADPADTNVTNAATFLYGRAHAAKHYFVGDSGSANIYFEAYCYGATCAKSLLPNGNDSKRTSDVRWYINEAHQAGDGKVQGLVTPVPIGYSAITPPSNGKSNSTITYDGSKSYPYTGELELNADAHLVDDNSKSFQAEFSKDGAWAGRGDSDSTTQTIGTQRDDDNRTLKSNRVLW